MAGSIFEALSKKGNRNGKLGYTLTISPSGNFRGSGESSENFGSSQVSDNFEIADNAGFVQGSSYAVVDLCAYGSFVVSVNDGSDEEKLGLVSVPSFEQVEKGIDITSQKRFLANVFNDASDYQGLTYFVYGFGIDVKVFGLDFFSRYFPQIEWTHDKLIKLISRGCICCKVISNNCELTGIVTVNTSSNTGLPHVVFVPIPLIIGGFADDFASVYVKVNNKSEVVGGSAVYSTFDSSYDEETGEIGIGPSEIESELKSSKTVATEFVGTTLKKGSCKLFLNKSKRGEIEQILGNIPEIYEKNIFDDSINTSDKVVSGAIDKIVGNENDTCLFVNDVDWDAIKNSTTYRNYYTYKDVIVGECRAQNLNVRLIMAHMFEESSDRDVNENGKKSGASKALNSNAWKNQNNPGGMLGNLKSVHGVPCSSSNRQNISNETKTSHGRFLAFNSPSDGIRAMCRWVNKSSYYGVSTKNLKTVRDYANAMQNGVNGTSAYCYKCPNYASKILKHYANIPHIKM